MTRPEFIEWLKAEVTLSGALGIELPDKEYDRIIDRELKALYEYYPEAIKESYTIIPVAYFRRPDFRHNRTIQFPDCVYTVGRFQEMKRRNTLLGFNDPDFSYQRTFMADIWLNSTSMKAMAYRTMQWSIWDQMKNFILVDIQHEWSYPEHSLFVRGHDPRTDVFCQLFVKAEESRLFDDYWCQKWIAAYCKLQAAKLLSVFTINSIGGTQINMGSYTEEANKDIEECKNQFKQMVSNGFISSPG